MAKLFKFLVEDNKYSDCEYQLSYEEIRELIRVILQAERIPNYSQVIDVEIMNKIKQKIGLE